MFKSSRLLGQTSALLLSSLLTLALFPTVVSADTPTPVGLGSGGLVGSISPSTAFSLIGTDFTLGDVDPLSGALLGVSPTAALSNGSSQAVDLAAQQDLAFDVIAQSENARRLAEQRRREEEEKKRKEEEEKKRKELGSSRNAPPGARSSGSGNTVDAGGIKVDASIANNVRALLADARASGIVLSGWGWRSPQRTAELRIKNGCPDVHKSPSSSCRVPTARPGSSMHERGLAIDFTQGGSTLTRSSSGYHWLKANAARYGLYNLPSEAWHWSTNGR